MFSCRQYRTDHLPGRNMIEAMQRKSGLLKYTIGEGYVKPTAAVPRFVLWLDYVYCYNTYTDTITSRKMKARKMKTRKMKDFYSSI